MAKENIGNGIIYNGDALDVLKTLPDNFVDTVVTSPPYWALRDYGVEGQLGVEPDFHQYIERLTSIFEEIKRVLKDTGTAWVVIGDTYFSKSSNANYNQKSLCLIPERFAISMVDHGWILRNDIIWNKPNALPSSAKDRFTVSHEHIFFFVKNQKYYFKQQLERSLWAAVDKRAVYGPSNGGKAQSGQYSLNKGGVFRKDGMRNKRTVWNINTRGFPGPHFAVYPQEIPRICIDAGCPSNGTVLDPFLGSGTTALVAEKMNRRWIGIELNPSYVKIAKERIQKYVRSKPRMLFEEI